MEILIEIPGIPELHGMIDRAVEPSRGVVILIHGLGEHAGRYNEWRSRFNSRGYNMVRVDLPGHGRSKGKRGHIKSFAQTREIISILVNRCADEFPGQKIILYGHSLGGAIVLDYLVSGGNGISFSVVTSPWLRLAFEPSPFKMALASVMKNIMPGLVQPTGLVADHLSHDKNEVKKYVEDPLVHSVISVALFSSVYSAARSTLENGSKINVPLFLVHGTEDMIVSTSGSSELAEKSDNVTLRLWEGGYHELQNEPFREEVFNEIETWLSDKLK